MDENKTKRDKANILAYIVQNQNEWNNVKGLLHSDYFGNPEEKTRQYYEAFSSILDSGWQIDTGTLIDSLSSLPCNGGEIDGSDVKHTLKWMRSEDISGHNALRRIREIHSHYYNKEAIERINQLQFELAQGNSEISADELYAKIQLSVAQMAPKGTGKQLPKPKKASETNKTYFPNLFKKQNDFGVNIGFPKLQQMLGGITRGTLNCILAKTKSGKSMCLLNFAINAANNGVPVLYLDCGEMSEENTYDRIYANVSKTLTINDFKFGTIKGNKEKMDLATKTKDKVDKLPFYWISVGSLSCDEYIGAIRQWVTETVGLDETGKAKECLVVLDYIKTTAGDIANMKDTEWQMLGEITTKLKDCCTALGFPILSAVQGNRDYIKNNTGLAGIAGSQRISYYVDSLFDFGNKNDSQYAEDKSDAGEDTGWKFFRVLISRNSEETLPNEYLSVLFRGAYCDVREYKLRSEFRKTDTSNPKTGKTKIATYNKKSYGTQHPDPIPATGYSDFAAFGDPVIDDTPI